MGNSPKKRLVRFRPSRAALDGIRAYPKPSSPPRPAAPAATASQPAARSKRRWSNSDSRGGRFLRRHSGGRLATLESEATLMHIVTTFAVEVARAAAADRSTASTEEGDVRKALCKALPNNNRVAEPQTGSKKASKQQPQQPLHPCLFE